MAAYLRQRIATYRIALFLLIRIALCLLQRIALILWAAINASALSVKHLSGDWFLDFGATSTFLDSSFRIALAQKGYSIFFSNVATIPFRG